MLRYLTAGESHGKQLTVIIDGMPAGLKIKEDDINIELAARQQGYGRGDRMKIEKDKVEILSGVRWGQTIGSPICLAIKNLDWNNWKKIMSVDEKFIDNKVLQLSPRPGHADLAGIHKFNRKDIRDILERASARETAARVAVGAVCKKLLSSFNITVNSFVREIGGIVASVECIKMKNIIEASAKSVLKTPDKKAEKEMKGIINQAKENGNTLGGVFTVVCRHLPVGLGSYTQWDKKLDAKIAQSLISVQAVKGVEFGLGFGYGCSLGSESHDEIFYTKNRGYYRRSNNAGGFEGGMTNGEDIIVSCVMKPIPSLVKPLKSINIKTKVQVDAANVRSDVCAVPAASVVGESVVAYELACAFKEKFGADSMEELISNYENYLVQIEKI